MWTRVQIENFRALERFELGDLGRVNLIVGENNCGKTSVLEAIELLSTEGDVASIWSTLSRRGEQYEPRRPLSAEAPVDVRHLFRGHAGGAFAIRGQNGSSGAELRVSYDPGSEQQLLFDPELERTSDLGSADLTEASSDEEHSAALTERHRRPRGRLHVAWSHGDTKGAQNIRLGPHGDLYLPRGPTPVREETPPVLFVTTQSLRPARAIDLYESIVLTPDEVIVLESLRLVEPTIERIAPLGSARRFSGERGGMVVKCTDNPSRVPIGSMGDGIWRLLSIALCLARCRRGVLLVDEIDTGLHYSVLAKMWNLVAVTAEKLDVQIFATTHSRDCYEALASIACTAPSDAPRVSIQRIEKGKTKAVTFTDNEILIAANRGIEVR